VLGRALIELKRGDSGETHDSGVGPDVWLEVVAKGCAQITFLKCSKVMEEGRLSCVRRCLIAKSKNRGKLYASFAFMSMYTIDWNPIQVHSSLTVFLSSSVFFRTACL
jgi:hypothetical protein